MYIYFDNSFFEQYIRYNWWVWFVYNAGYFSWFWSEKHHGM